MRASRRQKAKGSLAVSATCVTLAENAPPPRAPAFKAALMANPAAALKAEGIEVPAGVTVTVAENTEKHFHLVLPPAPTDELSLDELEAAAGGGPQGHMRKSDWNKWRASQG